jgi:hypothetical protein
MVSYRHHHTLGSYDPHDDRQLLMRSFGKIDTCCQSGGGSGGDEGLEPPDILRVRKAL